MVDCLTVLQSSTWAAVAPASFCLCFCFVFIKKKNPKKNCRLCVISHPCLTSIRTFPQAPPACRGVWETTFAFECSNTEKSIFGFSLLLAHPFIYWLDCFALPFCKTEKLFFFSEICRIFPESRLATFNHLSWKAMAFLSFPVTLLAWEMQNPPSACRVVMSNTSNYIHITLRLQNVTKIAVLMDTIVKKDMTKS